MSLTFSNPEWSEIDGPKPTEEAYSVAQTLLAGCKGNAPENKQNWGKRDEREKRELTGRFGPNKRHSLCMRRECSMR